MGINQRTKEWHEERQDHIGSSDIAIIMVGKLYGKTIHDLWLEKTGRKEADPPNAAMIRGSEMESQARDNYIKQTNNAVIPRVVISENSFVMASLDGQSFDGKLIVEIKCPTSLKVIEELEKGIIAEHYTYQVQWQLMASKAEIAHLFIYHPDIEPFYKEIRPDMELQKQMLKKAEWFWNLVVKDIEPEKEEDKFMQMESQEFYMAAQYFKEIAEKKKAVEKEYDMAREMLLDQTDGGPFIGAGVKGTVLEKETVKWKEVCTKFGISKDALKPFTSISNYIMVKLEG